MAKKIPELSALAVGALGESGVWLTTAEHPLPVKAPTASAPAR
jgi:hypothetical protein